MKALEEISKMCGEVKVTDDKDKNATRPLISITDLQKMKLFEAIIIRLRMSPFRTKLEPDFKMNWGIERKEEPYPSRIKQEVEIFDLKKFVTEEKSKHMANIKDSGFGSPNPFRPSTPGFQGMGAGMNSGFGQSPMPRNNFNSLDIDSMLKDLDEKFKELDRQEAEKKKNANSFLNIGEDVELPKKKETTTNRFFDSSPFMKNITTNNSINTNSEVESLDDFKKAIDAKVPDVSQPKVEQLEKNEKPKISVDSDSKIIGDNIISDDEFFDDFFGDDE